MQRKLKILYEGFTFHHNRTKNGRSYYRCEYARTEGVKCPVCISCEQGSPETMKYSSNKKQHEHEGKIKKRRGHPKNLDLKMYVEKPKKKQKKEVQILHRNNQNSDNPFDLCNSLTRFGENEEINYIQVPRNKWLQFISLFNSFDTFWQEMKAKIRMNENDRLFDTFQELKTKINEIMPINCNNQAENFGLENDSYYSGSLTQTKPHNNEKKIKNANPLSSTQKALLSSNYDENFNKSHKNAVVGIFNNVDEEENKSENFFDEEAERKSHMKEKTVDSEYHDRRNLPNHSTFLQYLEDLEKNGSDFSCGEIFYGEQNQSFEETVNMSNFLNNDQLNNISIISEEKLILHISFESE